MAKTLEETVVDLRLQVMALRELIARLIAYQAVDTGDPGAVLRSFADGAADRLAKMPSRDPTWLSMNEKIRHEVDAILMDAQKYLPDE